MNKRLLHVACLPFPTTQGTQALLFEMLRAEIEARGHASLLCYASSDERGGSFSYPGLRLLRVSGAKSSLRSGPSFLKLSADLRVVRALRARLDTFDHIFAHNVEAAWCVRLACAGVRNAPRWTYVAHTEMREELPTYFSGGNSIMNAGLRASGVALDLVSGAQQLSNATPAIVISPMLEKALQRRFPCEHIAPPWRLQHMATGEERNTARAHFAFPDDEVVALYAGNLDAYQGLEELSILSDRRIRLLIATNSTHRDLAGLSVFKGAQLTSLRDEGDRRLVHAACDFAVIPRRAPGGLPIKLLDAMARGVVVCANRRALAGLVIPSVFAAKTLESAIDQFLDSGKREGDQSFRKSIGEKNRNWIEQNCDLKSYWRNLSEFLWKFA